MRVIFWFILLRMNFDYGIAHAPHRDASHVARNIFYREMRPHMREMKQIRSKLAKMSTEMMRKRQAEQPSTILAHAMRLQRLREEDDGRERVKEGIENVRVINQPISDFMYQGDMLLDSRQIAQMMTDMRSDRLGDESNQNEQLYENSAFVNDSNEIAADLHGNTAASANVSQQHTSVFERLFDNENVLKKTFEAALVALVRGRQLKAEYNARRQRADQKSAKVSEEKIGERKEYIANVKQVRIRKTQTRGQNGKQRERIKRQAQTGRNFPRNQWDPSIPIPYYFDPTLGNEARRVVRMAVQFWTENTCLSFAENGAGFPRVRFFAGGGCFSQVGKAFHSTEQMISIGKGCEQFGIAAHEIGHTLGFFHGQARNDRDEFVSIVYSNLSPAMATQFAKQSADTNYNYGIKYDYGSVMHYSDTDSATNRVTMLAKEKIYQHTMGNNVQPSFLDVYEMNIYYRCIESCVTGANCKHGGYRHPRNCEACICPTGFGGADCSDSPLPENGPPVNCGRTVEANEDFQALTGGVSASSDIGLADRHATCFWHIQAPKGMRVEIRVRSLSGACADGCFYGGVEIKTRDFQRVGARICCRSDIRQLGILFSDSELAIVGAFSQYKKQSFTIIYRSVNAEEVPAEGYSNYPAEAPTEKALAKPEIVSPLEVETGKCYDVANNCYSLLRLCDSEVYRGLMERQCKATCMFCSADGKGGGGGGNRPRALFDVINDGVTATASACMPDHENCISWSVNGFCASAHYSAQVKREICPKACNLC